MKDLIAKLEAAQEGSRELDIECHKAIWPHLADAARIILPGFDADGADDPEALLWWKHGEQVDPYHDRLPFYTTSLDAALTLVPEGLKELCSETTTYSDGKSQASLCWGSVEPFDRRSVEAWAQSFPLALCIAALKARAA